VRWRLATALVLLAVASGLGAVALTAAAGRDRHVLDDPYGPSNQTQLQFGERSHWAQPWRGYLRTVPASRLVDALGINFNPPSDQVDVTAKELAAAGFRRARIEISWCRVSDGTPEQLTGLAGIRSTLLALRRNHLRPLVLLNANHGCPGPLRRLKVRVTERAAAGARQLTLDLASIRQIVPDHTGLDSTTEYKAAAFLFTNVKGNTVTLSRPLDHDLSPGTYAASTLRYEPFSREGEPSFEQTMSGWLRYVGLVTHEVKSVLGDEDFDVEVWNELSFGSDFLDIDKYYDPAIVPDAEQATEQQILAQTLAYIRDPRNGVTSVGVGDGFSNERPWEAGSTVPAGLTAIDKHPYPPRRTFPGGAVYSRVRPLDALGRPDGTMDAAGRWHDSFVPHYTAFFPEYYLTGIQTETDIRDLSPLTTPIYGTPHGRQTHPPHAPPPAVWLTEAGLDPAGIPSSVLPRFHAKSVLRWATSWVGEGAAAIYFYATSSPGWGFVSPAAAGGGASLRAVRSLTGALEEGAGPISRRRTLQLRSISDTHNAEQFAGDGTSAHPPLYDRDVIGFFPYQVSNGRVVVATYVMTRDLLHPYRTDLASSDPRRYDMPPEWFRLTIGGVSGIDHAVSLSDPLSGHSAGVRVVSRTHGELVVDVALTDSPRLLSLSNLKGRP
jgi:hypothetical protein